MQYLEILLMAFLLVCCISIIYIEDLLSAVLVYSAFGLVMSIIWILMEGPDLSITEAAVGAGITSILFFVVLKNIDRLDKGRQDDKAMEKTSAKVQRWYKGLPAVEEKEEYNENEDKPLINKGSFKLNKVLTVVLGVAICAILLMTVSKMPAYGDPNGPTMNEVIDRYVEKGLEETGAINIVAGIILDYRAFDTFGEAMMLFTSTMAVVALLKHPEEKALDEKEEK